MKKLVNCGECGNNTKQILDEKRDGFYDIWKSVCRNCFHIVKRKDTFKK